MNATELLADVAHRVTPIPTGPWVMRQVWLDLLFAHWPVAAEAVRPMIPPGLTLDTFEGEAWVGVVPFLMTGVRPRGAPAAPGLSTFPELNVRTYVTAQGVPGVYFFSLDAGNPIAVAIARSVFHLPYFNAAMRIERRGETIAYASHRTHRGAPAAEFAARYRPVAPVTLAPPGSLAAWLTERYALYTTAGARVFRGDIHHPRWPLQAAEWEVGADTMAASHGLALPDTPPLLHFARRQEVLIWPLRQVRWRWSAVEAMASHSNNGRTINS